MSRDSRLESLVYDRNSFLLNVQKYSYCTQNFAEILFNRKRNMLLLPTEISRIIHLSVHNRNRNIFLFITEITVINRK